MVLIVVAALLSSLSLSTVLSAWMSGFVGDTDPYVRTMAPLAIGPDTRAALTSRGTHVALERLDGNALAVQLSDGTAGQGVPQNVANLINNLSEPIGSGLTPLVAVVLLAAADALLVGPFRPSVTARRTARRRITGSLRRAVLTRCAARSGGPVRAPLEGLLGHRRSPATRRRQSPAEQTAVPPRSRRSGLTGPEEARV
ncbi:hypothetical protein [Kitasatospora paranensis]|uniref:Uncharacterized protein n=1 Tax=Kitasatospora paranensis TaxID=258053 RepID=A0ABW2G810_9ACTN